MAEGLTKRFKRGLQIDSEETDTQEGEISVHPYTNEPGKAWQRISQIIKVTPKHPIDGYTPISENKVRFVCLSDTHSRIETLEGFRVPEGDVLLHAGDFTISGSAREVNTFNKYIGRLPHRHKIVIAGNHDMCLDDDYVTSLNERLKNIAKEDYLTRKYGVKRSQDLLTNCVYLLDQMVEVAGIKIYGAPWQPSFCTWGFQLDRGMPLLEKWNMIPDDVDVLMTHGPPVGIGDRLNNGLHVGCVELLNTVLHRVQPKFHVFGHIHEAYGMWAAGTTSFINASTVTIKYRPVNPPMVFDIDLPHGKTKDDMIMYSQDGSICSFTL